MSIIIILKIYKYLYIYNNTHNIEILIIHSNIKIYIEF